MTRNRNYRWRPFRVMPNPTLLRLRKAPRCAALSRMFTDSLITALAVQESVFRFGEPVRPALAKGR